MAGESSLAFDIPAQPLAAALLAYSQAAGAEVFVDDALVAGRRSAPLAGRYDTEAALRRLLTGTGLAVRRAGRNAFTLVAAPLGEPPMDQAPGWAKDPARARFFAGLQAAVQRVLCARPDMAPGRYRAALALWFDSAGAVVRSRLLSQDLDAGLGRALLAGLDAISAGAPPPPGLAQPVIFVILPRPPDVTGDCAARTLAGG